MITDDTIMFVPNVLDIEDWLEGEEAKEKRNWENRKKRKMSKKEVRKVVQKQECYQDLEDTAMLEKRMNDRMLPYELYCEVIRLVGTIPNDQELGGVIRKIFKNE